MRNERRGILAACALAALIIVGCSEDRTALDAELAAGQAAFEASDASETTRIARALLVSHPNDPGVLRLGSVAAWMRGDLDEAFKHAETGLRLLDGENPELGASLAFVAGSIASQRYGELGDPRDWGAANSHLENATTAGTNRVDAALALAQMHSSNDKRADRDRFVRFARLIVSLEPTSGAADIVRQVADALELTL